MKYKLVILLLLLNFHLFAQDESYLYRVNQYNFIRYDKNEMHNFGEDKYAKRFYSKLEKLVTTGEGRINVVQIGGSHIQAGTFSGQIRSRLQQINGEMNGGWGFMFPYRISRTNSPYGYYIRYNGGWQSVRNIEKRKSSNLGVGGIAAITSLPKAELTILLEDENKLDYSFNKLRVFYENAGAAYLVSVDTAILKNSVKTKDYFEIAVIPKTWELTNCVATSWCWVTRFDLSRAKAMDLRTLGSSRGGRSRRKPMNCTERSVTLRMSICGNRSRSGISSGLRSASASTSPSRKRRSRSPRSGAITKRRLSQCGFSCQ